MVVVCKECRNCDWFWEERNPDKECLGEEQPCERFMCLKDGIDNMSGRTKTTETDYKKETRRLRSENSGLCKELDETNELCKQLAQNIAGLMFKLDEHSPEWISVDEKLPEDEALVAAVRISNNNAYLLFGYTIGGSWYYDRDEEVHEPVHYWTPLPDIKPLFEDN